MLTAMFDISEDDARWLLRNSSNLKEAVMNGVIKRDAGVLIKKDALRMSTEAIAERDESTVHPL